MEEKGLIPQLNLNQSFATFNPELAKALGSDLSGCTISNGNIDLSSISESMRKELERKGLVPVTTIDVFPELKQLLGNGLDNVLDKNGNIEISKLSNQQRRILQKRGLLSSNSGQLLNKIEEEDSSYSESD